MAEENGGNGGKRTGLIDRVREDAENIKTLVREKGKEEIEGLKDPEKTQLYRSIFRVKHEETPRSRSLGVLSNVFLHLHPAKVNRDATRYNYTWGMGGITFYLFIVLTFTGVLLMFYYHPSKVQAFRDILYLENDVPFALLAGSIVDANGLLRACIWHCIGIPLIASIFMGVHFWRVRKDGGISGPAPVMLETEIKEEKGPRPVIMRPSGMV